MVCHGALRLLDGGRIPILHGITTAERYLFVQLAQGACFHTIVLHIGDDIIILGHRGLYIVYGVVSFVLELSNKCVMSPFFCCFSLICFGCVLLL